MIDTPAQLRAKIEQLTRERDKAVDANTLSRIKLQVLRGTVENVIAAMDRQAIKIEATAAVCEHYPVPDGMPWVSIIGQLRAAMARS